MSRCIRLPRIGEFSVNLKKRLTRTGHRQDSKSLCTGLFTVFGDKYRCRRVMADGRYSDRVKTSLEAFVGRLGPPAVKGAKTVRWAGPAPGGLLSKRTDVVVDSTLYGTQRVLGDPAWVQLPGASGETAGDLTDAVDGVRGLVC